MPLPDFWAIVDGWLEMNAWATGSTEEFIALAESVSGQDLDAFFETWLFTSESRPRRPWFPPSRAHARPVPPWPHEMPPGGRPSGCGSSTPAREEAYEVAARPSG